MPKPQWQSQSIATIPSEFLQAVQKLCPDSDGKFAAQLLWQRDINNVEKLLPFVNCDRYTPTSAFAFGEEMKWAMQRLQKAREKGEKIVIWGDFDADGITATSVLWEGLGQFFSQGEQLGFYIPNRLQESHGLHMTQLERFKNAGVGLIITCDTGSTNLKEIDYAQQLGIDLIITDHHTLPDQRPPVIAIINPRYFAENHPLYHLSGVAVAYKLVEAWYETWPNIAEKPLESLLDLVAIGLIADLVQLTGDCRYLAQKGLQKLKQQANIFDRPGVATLLKFCQKSGDRPTDISFGIGPRLNAISRIQGDAAFAVELLTSRDEKRCSQLATETELANTRRKELQKIVAKQAQKQLENLDLSTTGIIILNDQQWPSGILGLVASQIAQEYGKPALLLTNRENLAVGSARSVRGINLYELLKSQQHLMTGFGGHPLAAGLSLPLANLPLFREAINQQLWQQYPDLINLKPQIDIDLTVTVADLGKALFRELSLLEPYGMGNPVPKLRLNNCKFDQVWNQKMRDTKGKQVQYVRTYFVLKDDTVTTGFPGIWWGHNRDEIPLEQACDVVVELDYNPFEKRYEVRLIDLRLTAINTSSEISSISPLLDRRNHSEQTFNTADVYALKQCPVHWSDLQQAYKTAIAANQHLALAYQKPGNSPEDILEKLFTITHNCSQKQETISVKSFQEKIGLSQNSFSLALNLLQKIGFSYQENQGYLIFLSPITPQNLEAINEFLAALKEEQFQQHYFCKAPLTTLAERLQKSP